MQVDGRAVDAARLTFTRVGETGGKGRLVLTRAGGFFSVWLPLGRYHVAERRPAAAPMNARASA